MKKLALKLDDLQVESFETDLVEAERGTVEAHATDGVCSGLQCTGVLKSCAFTCDPSCETHVCSC